MFAPAVWFSIVTRPRWAASVVLSRPHTAHDVISSSADWLQSRWIFLGGACLNAANACQTTHALYTCCCRCIYSQSWMHHLNPVLASSSFFCNYFQLQYKTSGKFPDSPLKKNSGVNDWGAAVLFCWWAKFVFCDQSVSWQRSRFSDCGKQ